MKAEEPRSVTRGILEFESWLVHGEAAPYEMVVVATGKGPARIASGSSNGQELELE